MKATFDLIVYAVLVLGSLYTFYQWAKGWRRDGISGNEKVKELEEKMAAMMHKYEMLEVRFKNHDIDLVQAREEIKSLQKNYVDFIKDMYSFFHK